MTDIKKYTTIMTKYTLFPKMVTSALPIIIQNKVIFANALFHNLDPILQIS